MTTLTSAEVQALHEALADEYQAWATYDQVIADFGEVRPFINIRESESRHIAALQRLFATYGLPVPANSWPGKVPRYASLQEACEAGVAAEVANGAMYERLLAATDRPDILAVFRNLQEASQQRHLEAFRRCAQRRGTGQRCGEGRGRRSRHRAAPGRDGRPGNPRNARAVGGTVRPDPGPPPLQGVVRPPIPSCAASACASGSAG